MVIIMQTSKVKRLGSGYSSIYKTSEWQQEQHDFEIRLGKYAYTHPKSHEAVNKGLSRMKNILWAYYHDQFVNLGKKEFFLRAFTKDDPSMAGQVGRMVGEEIFKIIGDNFTQKIDKTLSGSSSNLREKMTAFYNASGISSDASNQSINFKNIMQKIVTSNSRTSNYLINKLGLDKNSVDEAIRHNSKNIFKAGLSSGLHNLFKGPDVYGKYGMNFKSKDKDDNDLKFKYTNMDDKKKNIRNPFNNPLPLSQRELNFYNSTHFPKFEKPNMLFYTMLTMLTQKTDALEPYIDKDITEESHDIISKNGFRLTENGSSSTTTKLLNTAKWLGLKGQDLLNFRLALMGWLLPDGNHSLYEILYSSHAAGVRGKNEDLTDAASMDETIDPLKKDELINNCGLEQDGESMLPIDKIIFNIFTSPSSPLSIPISPKDAKLLSIKSYTLVNHQIMNEQLSQSKYLGPIISKYTLSKKYKNDPYVKLLLAKSLIFRMIDIINSDDLNNPKDIDLSDEPAKSFHLCNYIKSIDTPENKNYPSNLIEYLKNESNKVLDISSSIKNKPFQFFDSMTTTKPEFVNFAEQLCDNILKSNTIFSKLIDDTSILSNHLLNFMHNAPKYEGKVYSGQWKMKSSTFTSYRKGNVISLDSFTSTSFDPRVAVNFLKAPFSSSKEVLLINKLKHLNAVDISTFSSNNGESEVLLPPGTKLYIQDVIESDYSKLENDDKLKLLYIMLDPNTPNDKKDLLKRGITIVYLEEVEDNYSKLPRLHTTRFT